MNFQISHFCPTRHLKLPLQGVRTLNTPSSHQSSLIDSHNWFSAVAELILPFLPYIFSDMEQQNIEPLRNLILIMCLNSLKLLHWINSSFVFVKKMLRLIWYGEIYWNKNNIYVLLSWGIIYVPARPQNFKF